MQNKIDAFLKETMSGNVKSISLRIPHELEELLKQTASEQGYHEKEFPTFLREMLALAILPNILKKELYSTNEMWFINQVKDVLEFHLGKPAQRLTKIKEIAELGIEKYNEYFDTITELEVKLKNSMFEEISKEKK